MFKVYNKILTLFIALFITNAKCKEEGKIIDGEQVQIEAFPYQVSFQYNKYHFCGGSIYKKNWIITAAHCVQQFNGSTNGLSIVAGQTKLSDTTGQRIAVVAMVIHPKYTEKGEDYDVAVLKLQGPLSFNNKVQNLQLPSKSVGAGNKVIVSGWGTTKRGGGGNVSNTLLAAVVRVQAQFFCELQYFLTLTRRMFCAGKVFGGSDSCQGDSGGPVKYNNALVGIISFGRGCGDAFSPGVYTNIFVVKNFIEQVAK